jgi:muramoyltetrapeptide carboxypeptidase
MLGAVTLTMPPALAPGDCIAIVAPASPFPQGDLWRGLAWLRTRYVLKVSPQLFARDGYLAGDDDRRAGELAQALRDDDVKAVVAARGGYGAMRIVEKIAWADLARRPRWIVGFSDVTALHAEAWAAGIASVHGPNVTGLGRDGSPAVRAAWLRSLERPAAPHRWTNLAVVHEGRGGGPLVGGNLSLVHAMSAAHRLAVPQGAVLALEDVTEAPYRVDRMLTSLRLAGVLHRASAIVFGGFDRCPPGPDGRVIEDVLAERTRDLGIPVLRGAPFGHAPHNEAFVIGRSARVSGDALVFD